MRGYALIVLILAMFDSFVFGQQETGSTSSNPTASAIPGGEASFTPEQLKQYYLVYTNPDVRYLRTLFDEYLGGGARRDDEFSLLKGWSSDYYSSKFVVLSRDRNPFGGTFITIMFKDRPDKIFIAWVYAEGSAGKLTLRRFDPSPKFTEQDIKQVRIRYRKLLEDKEHAM